MEFQNDLHYIAHPILAHFRFGVNNSKAEDWLCRASNCDMPELALIDMSPIGGGHPSTR